MLGPSCVATHIERRIATTAVERQQLGDQRDISFGRCSRTEQCFEFVELDLEWIVTVETSGML